MLNGQYFNGLELDVINNKYYDADRVDEILYDIRKQAEAMSAEMEQLRRELAEKETPVTISRQSDEFYIRNVYKLYSTIRANYESSIAGLDAEWQKFLASASETSPGDLKAKVAGIAEAIDEIESGTPFSL